MTATLLRAATWPRVSSLWRLIGIVISDGEGYFWWLVHKHRAKAVTFGSFQVLRIIERSLDGALHCPWVSQAQREIREGDTHYRNR
ncbi:hypothetical protein DOCECA_14305 [Pseudomonas sp. E102]